MGLSDFTSIFSRSFVIGFFLPAYVSLVALWLFASSDFTPNALEEYSQATELLILGAVALVVGLALSGLSYNITRALEGYPLERVATWPILRHLYRAAIYWQRRSYDRLLAIRDDTTKPKQARSRAARELDKFFPQSREALLPTSLGNAMRAFERHSNIRWGLDGVTVWPRIEALLTAEERQAHIDARADLSLFLNGTVGAFVVGVCLAYDKAVNVPHPAWDWPLYLIPFALMYGLYSFSLNPALEWGAAVRASIDLHRLELYERLGVRKPRSFSDEREIAAKVNKALLFAHPLLPDDLWGQESDGEGAQVAPPRRGLGSWLRRWLAQGGTQ